MKSSIAVLALLCLSAAAGAGKVTFVAEPGPETGSVGTAMTAWQMEKAAASAGATWSEALVGKFKAPSNGRDSGLVALLDADAADAKVPTIVRLNFDGKQEFDKEFSLELKAAQNQGANFNASFGPKVLKVRHEGQTIPVWVQGNVTQGEYLLQDGPVRPGEKPQLKKVAYTRVTITAVSAMQAKVDFGSKTCTVRLVDTDGSFTYADPARIVLNRNMPAPYLLPGDGLMIDTGDGTFGKDCVKGLAGQPVRVAGKWYKLAVAADLSKVTAEALDAPTATVKVAADNWTCRLVSKDTVLDLRGGKDAVDVPAGDYYIMDFTLHGPTGAVAKGVVPSIVGCSAMADGSKSEAVKLESGKTVDLPIGPPLKASVKSAVNGQTVTFVLVFSDVGGYKITSITGNNGRPPAPKFSVVDSGGKTIYESTLEYG